MIKTAKGPLVTLPYTIECNDIPVMIVQHHESDYLLQAGEGPVRPALCRRARSARNSSRWRSTPTSRGQPHRIKYLEQIYDYVNKHEGVLHWNGEQIYDWYRGIAAQQLRAAE